MAFEPMDDDGATEEDLDQMMEQGEPVEVRQLPAGHLVRMVNGTELLVKIPTPHQVIAYNRALGFLQERAWKVQEDKKLTSEERYRKLLPFLVDMDSKSLAFAESMLPEPDDRMMVDEWLIQGVIDPADLVRQLQGTAKPRADDEDPEVVEVKKRPNPLKKATAAKKAANARRTRK